MKTLIRRSICVACILLVLTLFFSMFSLHLLDIVVYVLQGFWIVLLLLQFAFFFIAFRLVSTKSDRWTKFKYNYFIFNIILLMLVYIHLISVHSIMNYKARREIKTFLNQIDIESTTIKIDGKEISYKKPFYNELLNLRIILPERYTATKKVNCEITYGSEKLFLNISQKIGYNQYWVYYPKYRTTKHNSIGGFYSDVIDGEVFR